MKRFLFAAAAALIGLVSAPASATCRAGLLEQSVTGHVTHHGSVWGVQPPAQCYNGARGVPTQDRLAELGSGASVRLTCCVLPRSGAASRPGARPTNARPAATRAASPRPGTKSSTSRPAASRPTNKRPAAHRPAPSAGE